MCVCTMCVCGDNIRGPALMICCTHSMHTSIQLSTTTTGECYTEGLWVDTFIICQKIVNHVKMGLQTYILLSRSLHKFDVRLNEGIGLPQKHYVFRKQNNYEKSLHSQTHRHICSKSTSAGM